MARRKAFLLRIDQALHDELRRWADDELRSLNAQVEFLLRKALRERQGKKEEKEER
ncbi:MAG: hypothetical protein V2A76_11435 [Planctomycetota bacterium]